MSQEKPLDSVPLNFSQGDFLLLNLALALIMYGVALDLRWENFRYLVKNPKGFFWVIAHNFTALSAGFLSGKLVGLPLADVKTLTKETEIQNSGLGLVLIFTYFEGLGGMAIITGWRGIWHLISGMAIAGFWKLYT